MVDKTPDVDMNKSVKKRDCSNLSGGFIRNFPYIARRNAIATGFGGCNVDAFHSLFDRG